MITLHSAPQYTSPPGTLETLCAALKSRVIQSRETSGDIVLTIQRDEVDAVLRQLRGDHEYQQLMGIAVADHPARSDRFDVVYMLLSVTTNQRLMVKVTAAETTPVPTATHLWLNAGWLEKEVHSMYGVPFSGEQHRALPADEKAAPAPPASIWSHGDRGSA